MSSQDTARPLQTFFSTGMTDGPGQIYLKHRIVNLSIPIQGLEKVQMGQHIHEQFVVSGLLKRNNPLVIDL